MGKLLFKFFRATALPVRSSVIALGALENKAGMVESHLPRLFGRASIE